MRGKRTSELNTVKKYLLFQMLLGQLETLNMDFGLDKCIEYKFFI